MECHVKALRGRCRSESTILLTDYPPRSPSTLCMQKPFPTLSTALLPSGATLRIRGTECATKSFYVAQYNDMRPSLD